MARMYAGRWLSRMAKDILDELFYGQIIPWEEGPHDKETASQLNREMSELWEIIQKRVDSDTFALFEKLTAFRADLSMMLQRDSFKTGFRLGAQIILAALGEEKST